MGIWRRLALKTPFLAKTARGKMETAEQQEMAARHTKSLSRNKEKRARNELDQYLHKPNAAGGFSASLRKADVGKYHTTAINLPGNRGLADQQVTGFIMGLRAKQAEDYRKARKKMR